MKEKTPSACRVCARVQEVIRGEVGESYRWRQVRSVFGTYNIRNGRKGGLESALRGMSQANVDLGIFQEKKVTTGIYTRESSGYRVVALEAPSAYIGGVALFYCAAEHFFVKALQIHVANVASFQLVSGGQRWYIVGCYLAPDNPLTIEDVVAFIIQRPQGATLLVDGDFNNDLAAPEGWAQEKEIVAALAVTEMEDMSAYFLPHNKSWLKDIKTWFMRRGGWEM